jgi:hypothetical protein
MYVSQFLFLTIFDSTKPFGTNTKIIEGQTTLPIEIMI